MFGSPTRMGGWAGLVYAHTKQCLLYFWLSVHAGAICLAMHIHQARSWDQIKNRDDRAKQANLVDSGNCCTQIGSTLS